MSASINPTVRRRRLGAELRRLREQKGMTAEEVAQRLMVSQSKISRLENGRRSISPRDVRDLCDVYNVDEPRMRNSLMEMAKESRQRGWWHEFGDIPYSVYIGLEAEASSIRSYESSFIPGLLQTREYAEAVVMGTQPDTDAGSIRRRVEVRLKRQDRISGDDRIENFWAVIDEAALAREVGGGAVMGDQMRRLLELGEQPNITLQVIPFVRGAHPGMTGTFSLMEFPESADSTVVYFEGVTSDLYLEKDVDVRRYTGLYDHLRAAALSVAETRSLITDYAEAYQK
ncbi:transcriptional regulator with XRE-family HTH domain [Kitasatospora sp. MAP12-15]|uniref:helix-turn-helix domain-containing protein n=1 Tax=unclassified Kitasatospora TaxID=2633591 RepID=UPI002474AB74|nr:helix-turn-helix transcriptional regulator [Kitasatospora sp. MAP12-44]MDH6112412.1 transcriptional regulator with XRE-family HTH domain [Kitasatospora sp. MAP12-44]